MSAEDNGRAGRRRFKVPGPFVLISLGAVVLIALSAVLAPILAPFDPSALDLRARLQPPAWLDGGSMRHPLGTDATGRDILSRLLYGGRGGAGTT